MPLRSKLLSTVSACLLLWATVSAPAQEPTGIISGTITDASGAVVPDATITITNKGTGAARTAVTNAEGLYSAPALLPGEYEVRLERPGFRTVVSEVQVVAGGTATRNLAIVPGAPNETVVVETSAAQVEYDTHSLGGVIERGTIQDLPLNGRSALQLATLEPGVAVVPGSVSQFNAMFN